jgi:hypothetical protein
VWGEEAFIILDILLTGLLTCPYIFSILIGLNGIEFIYLIYQITHMNMLFLLYFFIFNKFLKI